MRADKRPVRDYMTPLPQVIGVDQTLAAAARRMHLLAVRHLPVVDDGVLVGILSERDVALVRSSRSIDPEEASVEEAMTPDPYAVGPEMPLALVVQTMAERKVGSAVVIERGRVIGLLTTTDALALLADLLFGDRGLGDEGPAPSEVRARILSEHKVIREQIGRAEDLAIRVLTGDDAAGPELRAQARELYRTLLRHIDLEDRILAPALQEADVFGPERAAKLLGGHAKQRTRYRDALTRLGADPVSETEEPLAQSIQALIPHVQAEMALEERELLHDRLLRDSVTPGDLLTG